MSYKAAFLAGLVASGLALSPALAQAPGPTQSQSEMSDTTKRAAADKGDPAHYVTNAAISDLFEVESGKLATTKAREDRVKDFGRMMVRDHTDSTKKLKDAVKSANVNVEPPDELDDEHKKMLEQLKDASDGRFDRMYMDMQVKGHNQALELHRGYARAGEVEALKSFANEVVPVIEKHREVARELASEVTRGAVMGISPPEKK